MRTRPSVSILILLLVIAIPTISQNIIFNRVPQPPGEKSWNIRCITQDAQGFMWFGLAGLGFTGLYRYDGFQTVAYKNEPLNANSIAANNVECLYADSSGLIWMGTYGHGLDVLDPATGIFKHFVHRPNDLASLGNDTVLAIIEDREGVLWVGTLKGLDRMDPGTKKFTHYRHVENDPTSLSDNKIGIIYEDRQGTLWVGTGNAYYGEVAPGTGGLNRLDKKTGRFTRFMHSPKDPHSLIDNRVQSIFEDSRGNFWIGTAGDGLHTMDRAQGIFERHLYDPTQPEKLSRPPIHKTAPQHPTDHITFITEDSAKAIWIGTLMGGINRYDQVTKKITNYILGKDSLGGFTDNSGWYAYNSREGVLWICTWEENLFRVDPFRKPLPYYYVGQDCYSFYKEADGSIWIATYNGLLHTDPGGKIQKKYLNDPKNPTSLSENNVSMIRKDHEKSFWVATLQGGINHFDSLTEKFIRYQHDPKNSSSLIDNTVSAIYKDRNGDLWVGTAAGLDQMDHKTGKFFHFRNDPKDSTSLSQNNVVCIMEDKENLLWIGSRDGGGLNQLNRKTGKFKRYLYGNISCIFQDGEKNFWAGGETGLYHFDGASDKFLTFVDPNSGVNIKNVMSILEDDQNNLWICTSSAIIRINKKRDSIKIYGKELGVGNNTIIRQDGFKGPRGDIIFGDQNGYYDFVPSQVRGNSVPPIVALTDFRLGQQSVIPGNGSPLSVPLSQAKQIRLNYKQNVFSFDFAIMHYSDPENNRHMFMLEGYDNTWRTEQRAYYFNIPPGDYTFRVKGANNYGMWSEKDIQIIITPPWYRRWWAYILFAMLIAGGIWGLVHYRSLSLIREKRVLEHNVNLRTAEVVKQKEEIAIQRDNLKQTVQELKKTQTQLIQSEKMASLGELTAGIAHEIQNPLNFVNNFSEVNTELIDELEQEIEKGNVREAKEIANEIKENEQKISHHGKRADAIIKGMLQHSRASTGQKELTDINALADEYLRLSYHGMRATDKSFNSTLQTDFDTNLGKINIIPQEIGRVLLNLFNNAFYGVTEKKKQQGETYIPTVSVSTRKLGDGIEITVRDNGIGIPQKVLDKIFQPFFTTKPTGQGTGLGLSLSYDIIKAHGGEIKVETIEKMYAEFTFRLPLN
jgi:ligand-binding sensor domain-containing protein/signal transduction histidine kinase